MAGIQINGAAQKLVLDSDADTYFEAGTDDVVNFYVGDTNQYKFTDGAIVPITNNDIDLGTSNLEFKDIYSDGVVYLDAISYGGTLVTATAAELNIMDGVTSTAAELNIMDGVTSTAAEINLIDGSAKSTSSITVADTDAIIIIDGTTTKQIPASDIKTYAGGAVSAINNATANELVTIGATTTELDAESTLTFDGSALVVGGTNPSITIGDAGTEDTKLVFDGNAQDFYIGLDDSADDLVIGVGSAVGTTPAISIDEDRVITWASGTSIVNSGTWGPYTVSTGKSLVMGV